MGVSMSEVFNTLQVYLGSLYVNDFNRFGRTWQVNVQADADVPQAGRGPQAAQGPQRARARWCRSARSPTVARRQRAGDDHALQHVPRGRRSTATPAPGVSSGQAIERMEGVASRSCRRRCGPSGPSWPCCSLQTGNTAMLRLRPGGGAGLPGAGGAVRELVAAAGGDPGRADVPALLDRRRACWPRWTSTSSRRSASSCWSAWRARTRS